MHAMRACRERDIDAIVHEYPRRGTTNSFDARRDETRHRAAIQITFADLHEMNARRRRSAYAPHERLLPGSAQPASIGDQTKDGTHGPT